MKMHNLSTVTGSKYDGVDIRGLYGATGTGTRQQPAIDKLEHDIAEGLKGMYAHLARFVTVRFVVINLDALDDYIERFEVGSACSRLPLRLLPLSLCCCCISRQVMQPWLVWSCSMSCQ